MLTGLDGFVALRDERGARRVVQVEVLAPAGEPGALGQERDRRQVPTVIISATGERRDALRALSVGAFGYLDRGLSARAMRRAIRGALRGEPAYSRAVLGERIRAEISTSASRATRVLALTPRQREVVALVATGASDKEIALALGIATATAQKHVTRALKRLDVPNRAAAVAATLV